MNDTELKRKELMKIFNSRKVVTMKEERTVVPAEELSCRPQAFYDFRATTYFTFLLKRLYINPKCADIVDWLIKKDPDMFAGKKKSVLVRRLRRFRKHLITKGKLKTIPESVLDMVMEKADVGGFDILVEKEKVLWIQRQRIEKALEFEDQRPMLSEATEKSLIVYNDMLMEFLKARQSLGLENSVPTESLNPAVLVQNLILKLGEKGKEGVELLKTTINERRNVVTGGVK